MATLSENETDFSAPLKALLQRSATTCNMTATHWEILSQAYGDEVFTEAIYRLTRLEMSAAEAKECILAIVKHQDGLCRAVGRDVSLLTAMCDYFQHVNPVVREPILVEVRLLQQKEDSAYRDELTGLFNRRYFNQEVPREMERFRRFGHSFSLIMLDLDHFKLFNDTHCHSAGDQALRDASRILIESARLYDRVVRYGGEEFAVILPQTAAAEALAVAERIRAAMQRHSVHYSGLDLGTITVSAGLASYPKDGLDMASLVRHADQALYQAKEERNRVCAYRDDQRSHPRYLLSDPLPLSMHAGPLGRLEASAWDISFGGLLCKTNALLSQDAALHLVLSDVSRGIHLPLSAVVRRIRRSDDRTYQLGLSFQLDSVEEQMKLLTLLDGRVDTMVEARQRPQEETAATP